MKKVYRKFLVALFLLIQINVTKEAMAATLMVTTTADSGAGSLRQAILDANASTGVLDVIQFNIPGDGPHTIQPESILPTITDEAVIDGLTQPGSGANTNSTDQGLNTTIGVELDGSLAGASAPGLKIENPTGPCVIRGLAINRFTASGVQLIDADDCRVEGCLLGTNVSGTVASPNTAEGVLIAGGHDNVIGGTDPSARNLISGNNSHGVIVVRSANEFTVGNKIQGNLIGTDITGSTAIQNLNSGILILLATDTLVGGTEEAASNLISGNTRHGIEFGDSAERTRILGNKIGSEVQGLAPLGNGSTGISLSSGFPPTIDTAIGGPEPGAGNIIGGARQGIQIQGSVTRTLIQGNFIGTDPTGTANLGNVFAGIQCFTAGNEILDNTIANNTFGINLGRGTLIEGNTITLNTVGVDISSVEGGNLITQNSIYLNTGLGIDLRTSFANSGPNFPQDEGDADSGGNGLQNFPILSSISESATGTIVDGSLSSMPDSMYRLEFFANVGQDGSGFGEGQTYIGSADVETDGTGMAVFSASVGALPAGQFFVTSTATDITVRAPATEPANNTSEFSPAISMGGQGLTVTTTVGESGGGTLNESILASNNMPGVQTIAFNIPADDPGHVYYRDDGIAGNVTPASVAATTESDDANIADIDPDWPHSWLSIKPLGQIEEITDPVVLDGFSQPGAVENTNPIEDGLNSVLRIEIDGTLALENANDLRFGFMRVTAGGSTIRGLAINRVYGPKIYLDGVYTAGDNNRVEGNYLGPDVSGTVAFPVGYATGVVTTFAGVLINSSSSNLIGGAADSARNLISGNDGFGGAGVLLQGFGSNSNRIQGNLIGTDRTGTRSIGIEQIGVRVGGVVDNTVGGSNPGEGNYIAGNSTGVEIGGHESRRNRVIGNWIGTDSTGSSEIGNTGPGVWVRDSPSHSLIQSNTIAHNDIGVLVVSSFNLLDATRNLITQNSIYRNKGLGIDLGFSSHADGPTPNDVPPESDPPDQDTGANNRQNFPILTSVTDNGGGTTVEGFLQSTPNSNFRIEFFANRERDESTGGKYSEGETYIGSVDVTTDGSGMSGITANLPALPELQPFITATATDITDRGDGPANDTSEFSPVEPLGGESTLVNNTGEIGLGTLREAIYVANLSEGSSTITFAIPPDDPRHFYYMDDGVSGTVSRLNVATTAEADDSNIADIDPDWPHSWFSIQPSHGLPELFDPINIDGFTQPGSVKNTLSAPQGLDSVLRIELDGANIEGDGFSLVVGAEISLIQGLVINRCGANGIHLDTFGGNRVMGNFIGTDVSGTLPLGNGLDGILLDAERYNRIGGAKPELRNLIAGNGSNEIEIKGSGADTVYGNLIGVDRRAQSIIRESTEVCFLVDGSFFAAIGGPEEGSGNFLGVDPEFGIRVSGINPSGFKQTGNPIDQLENCREELLAIQQDRETFFQSNSAEDFDVLDQTTAQFFGCIIFQNFIDQTRANSILQNQYLSEASNLGIDLGTDGATSNDPGDVDEGPNGLQNFPELTTATNEGGTTRVRGNFNSYPGIDYRLEFFSAPTPARAGETYLGFVEVLTDSGGNASFDFISSTSVSSGEYIVSTATLLYDIDADPQTPSSPLETSEFSAPIQVDRESGPCPQPYPDFNDDQTVDAIDLLMLLGGLESGNTALDLTEDSVVDKDDLLEFGLSWQRPNCAN